MTSRHINTRSGEKITILDDGRSDGSNPLVQVPVIDGPDQMRHVRLSIQPDGTLWGEYGSYGAFSAAPQPDGTVELQSNGAAWACAISDAVADGLRRHFGAVI